MKNRGITLIALVITIVVLIILAVVAINLALGNNGMINRAKTAKEQYSNAESYEKNATNEISDDIDRKVNSNRAGVTLSQEEYDGLIDRINTLEGSISFKRIISVSWSKTHSGYINNTTGGTGSIDLTSYNFQKTPYAIVSGTCAMTSKVTSVTTTTLNFDWHTAWGSSLGTGFGSIDFMLFEPN